MDLASILAKFTAPGPIVSRDELHTALEQLLECIATSANDVPSLLGTLASSTSGTLEAVLTSRSHNAFTFRSRVTKALKKSMSTSNPVFRTCASRLGSFLITVPPSVTLDQSVMEDYKALTSATSSEDPVEPSHSLAKDTRSGSTPPTKSGKRDKRTPVPSKKAFPQSDLAAESPASLDPLVGDDSVLLSRPKILARFIENFFSSCINEDIEEYGISSLLGILTANDTPTPLGVTPSTSMHQNNTSHSNNTPSSSAPSNTEAPSRPLRFIELKPEDIANFLNRTPKPKSRDWPVVVSQRGIKRLREFFPDRSDLFLRIEKKIRQLSVGYFPKMNQTKLLMKDFGVPIYTADLGDGLQLIYQIDFGAPTTTEDESQFIRVFGIFSQSNIDKAFWGSVATQLGGRGQGYIERCTSREETRIRFKGIETTPPMRGSPFSASQWSKDGADTETDDLNFLELHRVLALEKYIPLSRTFFEAIQKFDEHSFMFQLSSSEHRVVHHPSSCLVLGRSGTGKTTCMLFRMLILQNASQEFGRPLRQVFVSQSRMLVYRVQQYWKKLQQNEENAGTNGGQRSSPFSLLDLDDRAEGEDGLPPKFSELGDSHFPLFLTYDQLCKLLEADYDLQFQPSTHTSLAAFRARRTGKQIRHPLISFEFFLSDIWPHLDEKVKAGLHPVNVFGEFMGVIKGSEASFNSPKRQLDRQAYESQSSRTHADDQSTRSRIYTLFEAYMKKRPPSSYDMADRVHALMTEVQQKGVPGKGIDFLYVDEAQDHLILDAALLRSLCRNSHGLFFAGDTAQTISLGSAFRFDELKAFLYRLERGDSLVKKGSRKAVDPQFLQLSVNYRSHSGIVNAAAFLVHLIGSYFSYSIDLLTPETSLVNVCAQKPVFMLGRESQDEFLELFPGSTRGEVQLGADQAIIVRDDSAAKGLQTVVGDIPNLLTLYESKGLEFDDVVLYDFFADAAATSTDWRAIRHSQCLGKPFDERKHSILRRELKSLYVGLTRARARVWIWDRSNNATDLRDLLISLRLATPDHMVDSVLFGATSSPEEWSQRGDQYFSKGLYSKARGCFRNARMLWWEEVCGAYNDRQTASRLSQGHQSRVQIFLKAAEEFERLTSSSQDPVSPTTRCLLFTNAGECYAASSNYSAAAYAFVKAQKFTEAAYHYRLSGQFKKAIDLIRQPGSSVDQVVAESIIDEAKFVYTRSGDIDSLLEARDLCGSKKAFFEFLQDNGFNDQRVTFHDYLEEYEESGDILWLERKYLPAVDHFCRPNSASSWRKAKECLLEGLRDTISFANGYRKQSDTLTGLFGFSADVGLSQDEAEEVELLRDVATCASEHLKEKWRHYRLSGNTVHALFAFDAFIWSGILRSFQSSSEKEVLKILENCQTYHSLVKAVVRIRGILDKPAAQYIFGVSISKSADGSQEETISVKYPSFAYTALMESELAPINAAESTISVAVPKLELADLICQALQARSNQAISDVDFLARKSRAFQLCASFLTMGWCDDPAAPCWKDHLEETDSASTTRTFNSQFRLHIVMISLISRYTVLRKEEARTRAEKQRIWLARLFKLCYPPTNKCGSLLDIKPSLIPEYQQVMPMIKSCLRENFKGLRPSENPKNFLDNVLITSLLATAFDYIAAASYLDFQEQKLDKDLPPAKRAQNKKRDTDFAKEFGLLYPGTNDRLLAEAVLIWCTQKTTHNTETTVSFLEDVLTGGVWLDIEVAVAFIEEVCGQLIFNYKMQHTDDLHDLLMPRSWIMRALCRGPSSLPSNQTLRTLAISLGNFIKILSLKGYDDDCRLRIEGASLKDEKSRTRRNRASIQVCRCLALVGHNIARLRGQVLTIFNAMDNCPFLEVAWKDQSESTSLEWANIVDALKSVSSDFDALLVVRRKEGVANDVSGSKKVSSLDAVSLANQPPLLPGSSVSHQYFWHSLESTPGELESARNGARFSPHSNQVGMHSELLEKLIRSTQNPFRTLSSTPSRSSTSKTPDAPSNTTNPREQPLSRPVRALSLLQISREDCKEKLSQQPVYDTASNKSPGDIQHLNGSATTIRSFFCLHQSLSDGSIMPTFECAAKLRIQMGEACADDRFFVFCLRGLLLHVAAYLERARASAHSEVKIFEDRFSNKEGKPLDDSQLTTRVWKLRDIRDLAKKLLDELQPMSEFHFDGTRNAPASLSEMLDKVHTIPGLVESLRPFTPLPNNTLPTKINDEFEVEPLLVSLAPWTRKEST